MRRGASIRCVILCLIFIPATLCAQNLPINLRYQENLIIRELTFFQHDFTETQILTTIPAALTGYASFTNIESITGFKRSFFSLIKNKNIIYEYWQSLKLSPQEIWQGLIKKTKHFPVNRKVFNGLYNKPGVDKKKMLRQAWKKVFGIDVWYPYYKAKEIEDWVKERISVRVCGFKGRPKFERDQIVYVFKKKF